MYSQNKEEEIIINHFLSRNIKLGNVSFIDLGAYDGIRLSNTRRIWELGATGVMVEMGLSIFEQLKKNYERQKRIYLYNYGVSIVNGSAMYFDTEEPLSTLLESETDRWNNVTYERKIARLRNVNTLLKEIEFNNNITKFDVVSIDCEGLDYEILSQFDFEKTQTSIVVVEANGKEEQKYIDYCNTFGFKLTHANSENLIFER